MKLRNLLQIVAFGCLSTQALTEPFSVCDFHPTSGAGLSSGGVYSITGGVANTPSTQARGGPYEVEGVFQVHFIPPATEFSLRMAVLPDGGIQLSWPPETGVDFVLESTSTLSRSVWERVERVPGVYARRLEPTSNSLYFRLRRP